MLGKPPRLVEHRIEPTMRNMRAKPKLMNMTTKVTFVAASVSAARNGVRAMATMNPIVFAYTFTKPQLMLSPTPKWAVYATAIS